MTKYCLLLLPRDGEAQCATAKSPQDLIIRSLHLIFVFSELCLLSHGLLPLPSLGAPHISTPTPRSVEYSTGAPSPCNSHNGGSSPGLEFFTQVRPYLLDFWPALPRTPPHGSPSPIVRMTSPELSQGARGPRSPLPPAPEQGVPRRRLGVTKTSSPGLGANSQVPPRPERLGIVFFFTPPSPDRLALCRSPSRRPQGCWNDDTWEISLHSRTSSFSESQWTLATPPGSSEVELIKMILLHR